MMDGDYLISKSQAKVGLFNLKESLPFGVV